MLLYFWGLGAVPAIVLSLPVVTLGWRRVRWYWWESLGLMLPFCSWLAAYYFWPLSESSKGIGNLFGEPMLIGLLVPFAAVLRVIIGKGRQIHQRAVAAAVLLGLCVAAAAMHLALPNLGGTI